MRRTLLQGFSNSTIIFHNGKHEECRKILLEACVSITIPLCLRKFRQHGKCGGTPMRLLLTTTLGVGLLVISGSGSLPVAADGPAAPAVADAPGPKAAAAPTADESDEQLLAKVGVKTDDATLLAVLRKGSQNDPVRQAIVRSIEQLGDEAQRNRDQAGKKLIAIGTLAVPDLREATKSPDVEVARRAVDCLKQLNVPEQPEIDPTENTRSAAELAMRAIKTRLPGHLAAVRVLLQHGKGKEVAEVCLSTLLTADEPMCKFVEILMQDSLCSFRWSVDGPDGLYGLLSIAQYKLLRPHVKAVIEGLEKAADSSDVSIRKGARATLTRWDWYEVPKRIREQLIPRQPRKGQDAEEQITAPLLLVAKRVAPVLAEGMKDPDPRVREHAVNTTWNMRLAAEQLIPALTAVILYDENEDARTDAIRALETFDEDAKAAVPVLAKAMKQHKGKATASYAAVTLARLTPNDESLIPWLIEAVERREAVLWSTGALTSYGPKAKAGLPAMIRLLQMELKEDPTGHSKEYLAANIILLLGRFGPEAVPAVPMLSDILLEDKETLSDYAAKALAEIGPAAKGAVPSLIKLVKNPNADYYIGDGRIIAPTRRRAIEVLGAIGPEAVAAVPILTDLFLENEELGIDASEALVKLGSAAKGAVPSLIEVLKNENAHSMHITQAIEILGAIGPAAEAAMPSLLKLQEEPKYKAIAEVVIRKIRDQK